MQVEITTPIQQGNVSISYTVLYVVSPDVIFNQWDVIIIHDSTRVFARDSYVRIPINSEFRPPCQRPPLGHTKYYRV